MKPQFEAINPKEELPPLAAPESSYFQMNTSSTVGLVIETHGGFKTMSCGVYDYKNSKWLTFGAVKTVIYWLKEV